MKKIIIWGTSIKAKKLIHCLNFNKAEIIGFTDNDFSKTYSDCFIDGYPFIPWEDILKMQYDYIIIASSAFCEITVQLLFHGVRSEKIIQAYNCQFMFPDALFFFNRLELDQDKYDVFARLDTLCFEAGIGDL